jgi:hypothetical protein
MKNTIFLFITALLFGASVNAQSTVDSINAKYQLLPMPQAMTLEKSFPVLGSYTLTTKEGTTVPVTITIDSASKGIVWVEGLPEGKFKAYLKRSPATYRVVAQKTETGKSIPEGTLIFDQATNTLNVALGKKFDDVDPAAIFTMNGDVTADVASGTEVKVKSKTATKKTKEKVVFYSATKADTTTTTSTNVNQQQ